MRLTLARAEFSAVRKAGSRLAWRVASAALGLAIFIATPISFVSLAVEYRSVSSDAALTIKTAADIALTAALEGADPARVVDALAVVEGVAWVKLDRRGEILARGDERAPTAFTIEAAAAGIWIYAGADREAVDLKLARSIPLRIAAIFAAAFGAAVLALLVFRISVARHLDTIAVTLERWHGALARTPEPMVLRRRSGSGPYADVLDRLVSAANALIARRARTEADLELARDAHHARAVERANAAEAATARFRDVAMLASDIVFETNEKSKFVYVSEQGGEWSGWLGGSIANLKPWPAATHDDREAVRRVKHAFAALVAVSEPSLRVVGPGEEERYLRIDARPTHAVGRDGAATGMRGCARDVTLDVRTAVAAQRGERVADLSRIVAGIAHEVNTPVGVSFTFTSILADTFKNAGRSETGDIVVPAADAVDVFAALDGIARNLERVTALVASFKQVSYDQAAELRRRFDLVEYLGEIRDSLAGLWKPKGIVFEIAPGPQVPVDSFPHVIARIVTNLVSNADMHAFEEGVSAKRGTVRFAASLDPDESGWVRLVYEDDGRGVSDETRRQMFEYFYTTRRNNGGTGLGLTIVRTDVTNTLGGAIAAVNRPEGGLRIEMRFPAVAPNLAEAALDQEKSE